MHPQSQHSIDAVSIERQQMQIPIYQFFTYLKSHSSSPPSAGIRVLSPLPSHWKSVLMDGRMANWLVTIILGVIEGVTEFLPISSTGHLLLAERWLGSHRSDLFNIVIQSGAVLAVIPLFWERISGLALHWRNSKVRDYAFKLGVAFAITCAGGLILDKFGFQLEDKPIPVAVALLVGGILFIVIERSLTGRRVSDDVSWNVAVIVGAGQLLAAVFPGASRSGTTILLCLLLGLSRSAATEFSFLVSIPTMLAAGGWKILKSLMRGNSGGPMENWGEVALGFLISAIVSFAVVRWLLGYIRNHTFAIFGWYRIALGILIILVAR